MTIRKLDDYESGPWGHTPCHNPEHNPPGMIVLPPGVYEHTCPGCGQITRFTVPPRPYCQGTDAIGRTVSRCINLPPSSPYESGR